MKTHGRVVLRRRTRRCAGRSLPEAAESETAERNTDRRTGGCEYGAAWT